MSVEKGRWLVPDGIEDILPKQAEQIEFWRREMLDEFSRWGYELVMPPIVEFTQSLLTGKAVDLALDTCQLVDQVSGRMMAIRSDMTPQAARIDANRMPTHLPTRLCYAGEVLRARPNEVTRSRSPIQVGAELFGHAGVQSDIEIMELMLATSQRIGLNQLTLTLGHVDLFRRLVAIAQLDEDVAEQGLSILQRKALPEWHTWCHHCLTQLDAKVQTAFSQLIQLCGDAEQVFAKTDALLVGLDKKIDQDLIRIKQIVQHLQASHSALNLHLDLADLRGFKYHTGVVFGLVEASKQRMIASGGRYDGAGDDFGVERAATGFSIDLRQLLDLTLPVKQKVCKKILAPAVVDADLLARIHQLRQEGNRVIIGFPDVDWASQKQGCDLELVKEKKQWVLR